MKSKSTAADVGEPPRKHTYAGLKAIVDGALVELFTEEGWYIATGVNERGVCGRLAIRLHQRSIDMLPGYWIDLEYNRNFGNKIKTIINQNAEVIRINCDVIIHSRGTNTDHDNLVAIEIKKSSRQPHEKDKDRERLIALTKDRFDDVWSHDGHTHPEHVCRYKLGIYLEYSVSGTVLIEYYRKGKLSSRGTLSFLAEVLRSDPSSQSQIIRQPP